MKWYSALAAFGFAILAFASVWLGGLNQDEGWYIYAAQLVADGHLPYRDFFFTQGPVMPMVYSLFSRVWAAWGLLGARILTLAIGTVGIVCAMALARRLAPAQGRGLAALLVALLLGSNLYHLYYLAIPKTYALASVFVMAGYVCLSRGDFVAGPLCAGVLFAFAAGTRVSLVALLPVVGLGLLWRGGRWRWLWFVAGGVLTLAAIYGPPLLAGESSRAGLAAAQAYHSARGGFDVVFSVGSLSRLVRWYMPVFVMFGLGVASRLCAARRGEDAAQGMPDGRERWRRFVIGLVLAGFFAVFAVQMLAPFPYEDYQVPVMGLFAAAAAALVSEGATASGRCLMPALLALGMTWAASFGSPLLQKWMINGQDRFWSIKKDKCELAQLREVAREIERLDPGGKMLLTQDLYLAVETGRRVPRQFAMGPFSYWGDSLPYAGAEGVALDDEGMLKLLGSAPCEVAAMSGYSFAITVPRCDETPFERQIAFWTVLKENYGRAFEVRDFGQNATTLIVMKRKDATADGAGGKDAP